MKRYLVALSLAAALCGGCSGESGAATTATPTPTVSVAQYASAVAETSRSVRESAVKVDDCDPTYEPLCDMNVLSLQFATETLEITLSGLGDPDSKTYIGEPPAEISDLVSDTLAQATATIAAAEAHGDCTDECDSEFFEAQYAAGRMESQLDAWAPYL